MGKSSGLKLWILFHAQLGSKHGTIIVVKSNLALFATCSCNPVRGH